MTGVALVTGASRGIGKASAVALAAAGFDVAIAARTLTDGTRRLEGADDVTVPGGLDTTAAEIEALGRTALPLRMDLLDRASVLAAASETAAALGPLDVLVNNGIYQGPESLMPILDLDDDGLGRMFEGNVFAPLALVKAVLPPMLDRGSGTIINLISQTAHRDPPGPIGKGGWGLSYAMTKAALARMAPLLHVEHGGQGIRAFSVDPGFVVTERMTATGRVGQFSAHFTPGTPETIGHAIAWLCTSPDADRFLGKVVHAQELAREWTDRV
jgi:NAD(P)-dependent dehydrogenase (short-subunit alcohol dehydrogenase family)